MAETWWVKPDELDEDQKKVVKLPGEGSFLIQGPPGCGKTNLLLLRANYIALLKKPTILILTFTRTLREFIAWGGTEYSFPPHKIQTHMSWSRDFLHSHDIPASNAKPFNKQRLEIAAQISALIDEKGLNNYYDAILLSPKQMLGLLRNALRSFTVRRALKIVIDKADSTCYI